MSDLKAKNPFVTAGNPTSFKDVMRNSNQLQIYKSCKDAQSPTRNQRSVSRQNRLRKNSQNAGSNLKGKFESEIQLMTNDQICSQIESNPIFKMKFEIWMKKVESYKTSGSTSSNSGGQDQIMQQDDVNEITFKKSKSLNILHQTKLYERCRNLLVNRILSMS